MEHQDRICRGVSGGVQDAGDGNLCQGFSGGAVARDQLEHAVPELSVHENGRIYKFVNDAVQAAVTGSQKPPEALADAQQQSDRVLRAYK